MPVSSGGVKGSKVDSPHSDNLAHEDSSSSDEDNDGKKGSDSRSGHREEKTEEFNVKYLMFN